MTTQAKTNIHQTINTVLLSVIGIVAGLIYNSNVRLNQKIDALTMDNQQNKAEIMVIKNTYETQLMAEREHNLLRENINNIKNK